MTAPQPATVHEFSIDESAAGKRLDKAYAANKALERRVALLTCVSPERW